MSQRTANVLHQPTLINAERQSVRARLKQRDAEPLFQQAHPAADRGRRDNQLFRGRRERAGPGGGFERAAEKK